MGFVDKLYTSIISLMQSYVFFMKKTIKKGKYEALSLFRFKRFYTMMLVNFAVALLHFCKIKVIGIPLI